MMKQETKSLSALQILAIISAATLILAVFYWMLWNEKGLFAPKIKYIPLNVVDLTEGTTHYYSYVRCTNFIDDNALTALSYPKRTSISKNHQPLLESFVPPDQNRKPNEHPFTEAEERKNKLKEDLQDKVDNVFMAEGFRPASITGNMINVEPLQLLAIHINVQSQKYKDSVVFRVKLEISRNGKIVLGSTESKPVSNSPIRKAYDTKPDHLQRIPLTDASKLDNSTLNRPISLRETTSDDYTVPEKEATKAIADITEKMMIDALRHLRNHYSR